MSDLYTDVEDLGMDLESHDIALPGAAECCRRCFPDAGEPPHRYGFLESGDFRVHGIRPAELIEAQKKGQKVFGTFCVYVPDEW